MTEPNRLGLKAAADAVARGAISAEELVRACIDRIRAREPEVHAFEFIDPEHALAEARARDNERTKGPLHGVPIGAKDIIDTADMPTGWGSSIYAGRRAPWDAGCIALARRAGAVILGKTVTTEFAYRRPGNTRNPRNLAHTPGGSSMGSAAAVADDMLPLAFGSQTAGSIIRPSSYCGVIGYKASFGDIDLEGVMALAPTLDSLGFMVRELEDIPLMRSVLAGDEAKPTARPHHDPPRIGLVRTHHWEEAEPASRDALEAAADALASAGAPVDEPRSPDEFERLAQVQPRIMAYDAARARAFEATVHRDRVSEAFAALADRGRAIPYAEYREDQDLAARCRRRLADVFESYDVLLAPSAPGEAPAGHDNTGDPVFNRMWTVLHAPLITLPVAAGPQGLPVGVQLIGRFGADNRLVADAAWVYERL